VDRKRALGRGLSALIGESRASLAANLSLDEARLRELPIDAIVVSRRQPRRSFATEELAELAASIKALGVVQPVVVRPLPGPASDERDGADPSDEERVGEDEFDPAARWELIAGERRLRAARLAGLSSLPALVRPADEVEALQIALAENVAREDLNPVEEALAYAALSDEFGLTHERIAELVGRSRVAVTNLLRLLELPDEVRRLIETGELTEGHGRALLALPDHEQRRLLAREVARSELSVRETEALVRSLGETPEGPKTERPARVDLSDVADELFGLLAAPVRVQAGRRGGSIQITFKTQDELERLLERLRRLGD
jgi:ParB family transcriptional regulator, chromosome partitioning protein